MLANYAVCRKIMFFWKLKKASRMRWCFGRCVRSCVFCVAIRPNDKWPKEKNMLDESHAAVGVGCREKNVQFFSLQNDRCRRIWVSVKELHEFFCVLAIIIWSKVAKQIKQKATGMKKGIFFFLNSES